MKCSIKFLNIRNTLKVHSKNFDCDLLFSLLFIQAELLLQQEEILAYNCKSALTGKVIPSSILQDPNTIVENLHYDEYINVLGFN